MDIIFNSKSAKKGIIIAIFAIIFLIIFPIFAVNFENTTTSEIITKYGYEGVEVYEGGNNYLTIPEESEELLKKHLADSGLWHTSIEASNEAQILWYKALSKRMENTSIGRANSSSTIQTSSGMNNSYLDANACERDYMGAYANDECDYNGNVDNTHSLKTYNPDNIIKACTNGNVYNVSTGSYNYYKSNETQKIIGGKILGLYPDVLVSASLANTYSSLDQNNILGFKIENEKDETEDNLQENIDKFGSLISMGIISGITGIITQLVEKLTSWYKSFDNVASATSALDDIFSEGSLYSTFNFTPESNCKAKDLIWYEESSIPDDYTCNLSESVYTEYQETKTCEKDEEGNDIEGTCKTSCEATTPVLTDGKSAGVPYPGPKSYYVDTNGGKHCLYKSGSNGKGYKLNVRWICGIEKAVPNIKCTDVTPIKDEEGTIHYYLCSGISESEVKTKIVDPILDAYENNTLQFNEFMTKETVNKFIYGFDESKYQDKINPKNFKFDEETRKIITKHVVMEILGETEGRRPAVADKDGNFYLQSINRVLNQEQYKEALNETILIKDNILRKESIGQNKEPDKDKMYSEKLYGVFYSEYNSKFNEWTKEQIETQKIKDKAAKTSQIMEIFSTYEYITYYLREYGHNNSQSTTTGSGLAQVDSNGFQQRVSAPSYSGYWDNGINIYYGECPWYALGRVREILANAGSDYNWTYAGNGGNWCDSVNKDKDNFKVVRDPLQAKPGSIVSWKDLSNGYGHVAIVEEVTPTTVTISESFIKLGIYGNSARSLIYNNGYNHSVASKNCEKNGCWQRRTLTYDQMKNAGWDGYKFQCYIQLLRDDDNSVAQYIINEFKRNGSMESKIKYYNFLTYTEGGEQIMNSNMLTPKYLSEVVSVTWDNLEKAEWVSVDPGLYIAKHGESFNAQINGVKYSYELCDGCKVPRWVALYTWIKTYHEHRDFVLKLIIEAGLLDKLNTDEKIHSLMRLAYTYGENGSREMIKEILNAYKTGGNHDVWCALSQYIVGAGAVTGNYFNMNEMTFDLFTTGTYARHPNYVFKYYTKDMVNTLMTRRDEKLGIEYLQQALDNGNIPQTNSYADCINSKYYR